MKTVDKLLVNPQGRFPTGQDDPTRRKGRQAPHDFVISHPDPVFVTGITKTTMKIATAETEEHRGRTGMVTFPLDAVENLVNLSHKQPHFLLTHGLRP